MKTSNDLTKLLYSIDRRGYPAYKSTRGSYRFDGYLLSIDHVQGDPFASPSAVSVTVRGTDAGFPKDFYDTRWRRIALQDHLLRRFGTLSADASRRTGSGKSGLITVSRPGQEILERSACHIAADGSVTVRFHIGFPAHGRTIDGKALISILSNDLPQIVHQSLFCSALDPAALRQVLELADDQQYIREQLASRGLVAFLADGSILPRESGVSQRPMRGAVPFQSPASLSVTLDLPHRGPVTGMGIPRGITLIVGGGFHGKSTLLQALERGVYPHIPGDGRELVITDERAVKLRAEDGRSIVRTDISMFIGDLPGGKDTSCFSTENASGSTSQAAATVEALEAGASALLIDEDTSATNFMVRDELMQQVITAGQEPITPYIDRARELYERFGVSTVLAAGSSGAWFTPADVIIQMDTYVPYDITARAKEAAAGFGSQVRTLHPASRLPERIPLADSSFRGGRLKVRSSGTDGFSIDHETTDLRCLEQLTDSEQTASLARLLVYAEKHLMDGTRTFPQILDALEDLLTKKGPEGAIDSGYLTSGLAGVRRQDILAAFARCRKLRIR